MHNSPARSESRAAAHSPKGSAKKIARRADVSTTKGQLQRSSSERNRGAGFSGALVPSPIHWEKSGVSLRRRSRSKASWTAARMASDLVLIWRSLMSSESACSNSAVRWMLIWDMGLLSALPCTESIQNGRGNQEETAPTGLGRGEECLGVRISRVRWAMGGDRGPGTERGRVSLGLRRGPSGRAIAAGVESEGRSCTCPPASD